MSKSEMFVAVSDLHSNRGAIRKIHKYIDDGYKVIILGDVTDRGPYGDGTNGIDMLLEIMELALSGKVIYIPGNHDELLYGYATSYRDDVIYAYVDTLSYNGGLATINDIDILRENDPYKYMKLINWLGSLPIQMVLEVDGQKYCFAHALFNQKIYDDNPLFSLRDFSKLKDYDYSSKYASIFWFRKNEDSYDNSELPSKDSIMIIGHTPQDNIGDDDFNLINNNGDIIRVINVDGGLAKGNSYMFEYTSDNDKIISSWLGGNNLSVNRQKSSVIRDKIIDAIMSSSSLMGIYLMLTASLVFGNGLAFNNVKSSEDKFKTISIDDSKDYIAYVVGSGDTLESIAYLYGISVDELISYNNISDPTNISIGTILMIPNVKKVKFLGYTIENGDTLYSISNYFGVDVDTIMKDNNIDSVNDIVVGSILKIRVSNKLDSFNNKTKTRKI